jgi:hypothetical protein
MQPIVEGVALEPGERLLVWSKKDGHTAPIAALVVLGVIFTPILLGLLFFYLAIAYKKRTTYAELFTDRRYVMIKGDGKATSMPWDSITSISVFRASRTVPRLQLKHPGGLVFISTVQSFDKAGGGRVYIDELLKRWREPGFLDTLVPTGRAAKL